MITGVGESLDFNDPVIQLSILPTNLLFIQPSIGPLRLNFVLKVAARSHQSLTLQFHSFG